jgi:GTP-binding protein Era
MQESMMASVKEALSDADIFLIVVEIGDHRFKDERILEKVKSSNVPIILAINKIDSSNQNQLEMDVAFWKDYFEDKAEILPISVIENFNISTLLNRISELIPIAPPWFPKDQISDRNDRFIVSEVIREKILELYDQEIPYSVQIEVETFKEEAKLISIRAVIIVSRDSQKSIIIGKGGAMIKRLGSVSRKSLETYFSKKVYLETFVKTDKNWRNDERKLKKYGY